MAELSDKPAPWDTFRIHITPAGTLRLDGRIGFVEPICTRCRQPIAWVLDMMSFTSEDGGYAAQHASCAWTPEAFDKQRARSQAGSPANDADPPALDWDYEAQATRDYVVDMATEGDVSPQCVHMLEIEPSLSFQWLEVDDGRCRFPPETDE